MRTKSGWVCYWNWSFLQEISGNVKTSAKVSKQPPFLIQFHKLHSSFFPSIKVNTSTALFQLLEQALELSLWSKKSASLTCRNRQICFDFRWFLSYPPQWWPVSHGGICLHLCLSHWGMGWACVTAPVPRAQGGTEGTLSFCRHQPHSKRFLVAAVLSVCVNAVFLAHSFNSHMHFMSFWGHGTWL